MGLISRSRLQNSGSAQVCAALGHSLISTSTSRLVVDYCLLVVAVSLLFMSFDVSQPSQTLDLNVTPTHRRREEPADHVSRRCVSWQQQTRVDGEALSGGNAATTHLG